MADPPRSDYDAVIVGASLAGSSAAILLGRAGARVALVDKRPEIDAFKRVCGHFIQASAVPTLERLGLLDEIEAAGATRCKARIWSRWGWIEPSPRSTAPASVNLRREHLDPIMRRAAAGTPGVDLILGRPCEALLGDGRAVAGVELGGRGDQRTRLRASLVIGADGRGSRVAELAAMPARTTPHGRFAYAAYYEGPAPPGAPDGSLWFTDPQWAAAFPTDNGVVNYACMPTKDRLGEFKRDPARALTDFIVSLPDAPPILDSKRISPMIGKLEMPNVSRRPTAPGLALIGDALLATDPVWGVGCGWAFESAEWLAESVATALVDGEDLGRGLARFRRTYRRRITPHAAMIADYATGRPLNPMERFLFAAAARDDLTALRLEAFATRTVGPQALGRPRTIGRAAAVNARALLPGRRRGALGAQPA